MSASVLKLSRAARRRLQRIVRKSKDGELVRRATAFLQLDHSGNVEVRRRLGGTMHASTVRRLLPLLECARPAVAAEPTQLYASSLRWCIE